jgi:hypothetical protein
MAMALAAVATFAVGCGGSGSLNNPTPPTPIVKVVCRDDPATLCRRDDQCTSGPCAWRVDVGQRFVLDGSESIDPENRGLTFLWSILNAASSAEFDDRCNDDPQTLCTSNVPACADDLTMLCATNADCNENIVCLQDAVSPQCATGTCLVGKGNTSDPASFISDVPGPYNMRVTVQSSLASNIGTIKLGTYPSLYLVGSLFEFGGTTGDLVGEFADAAQFADGAVRGAVDPSSGNIVLVIPNLDLVREFDYRTGAVTSRFEGSALRLSDPVALAFAADGRLYVADSDGVVSIFNGSNGLFLKQLGDVAGAGENVSSIGFDPASGNLLVADGGAGLGIRAFDANDGSSFGVLGDTATAVSQAVDFAFLGDPPTALFIADGAGDVVRCDADGAGCNAFGAVVSGLLAAGGPTAIAINPAGAFSNAEVLVADGVAEQVVGCAADGSACIAFGDTAGLSSGYSDIVFAPLSLPTTTSTTIPTTTMTTSTTSTTTTLPAS